MKRFGLIPDVPVNIYGHVGMVSSPNIIDNSIQYFLKIIT